MSKRIPLSDRTVPRIRESGPTVRRLDPDEVARALGAELCPERIEGQPGPFTLYALRNELFRRRQSSGGRPGIEGANLRAKIPLSGRDWASLEAVAGALAAEGFSPSAGQVASVLVSLALHSLTKDVEGQTPEHSGLATALAKELATRLTGENSG